jgi:signal transduction histidine kinase
VWSSVAEVSLELDRGLPLVGCDVTALKQAFFDILMAAVERGQKPAAAVRPRAVRGAAAPVGNQLQITVCTRRVEDGVEVSFRDNGPSLPAELQQALRDSESTPELLELLDRQGLGMAHSVVAVQHQGRLLDDSATGQGATLVVRLREDVQSPRAKEQPDAASASVAGRR